MFDSYASVRSVILFKLNGTHNFIRLACELQPLLVHSAQ